MASPTEYTLTSDSAYLTNGDVTPSACTGAVGTLCTKITVNNSTTYCVRIKREVGKWEGNSPLIAIPIPKIELHAVSEVSMIELGTFTELVEVKGMLEYTNEGGTYETAYEKETNLRTLCRSSENGLTLIIGSAADDQRVFKDTGEKAFVKKISVTSQGTTMRGGRDDPTKPWKKITMACSIGKNTFEKSG